MSTAASAGTQAGGAGARLFTISAHSGLIDWARELWEYRELFFFLAWRDITIRYRQTFLGAAWALLQPLVTMAVFTLLFAGVAKMPTNGMPAPLFYLSGLLPWMYFSTALGTAGNSVLVNAELLKKVYFPRIVLPASSALVGLVDFAFGAVLLVAMTAYYGLLSWRLLLWIPLGVLLWLFTVAVGAFLAAVSVRYRDVKHAIPFVIQIWLFLTPVIYPTSAVPARFESLLMLNPLSGIVESFRAASAASPLPWLYLGLSALLTLGTLAASLGYFRGAEPRFADGL